MKRQTITGFFTRGAGPGLRLFRNATLLLLVSAGAFVGCKQGRGDRCQQDSDCGSGLVCGASCALTTNPCVCEPIVGNGTGGTAMTPTGGTTGSGGAGGMSDQGQAATGGTSATGGDSGAAGGTTGAAGGASGDTGGAGGDAAGGAGDAAGGAGGGGEAGAGGGDAGGSAGATSVGGA